MLPLELSFKDANFNLFFDLFKKLKMKLSKFHIEPRDWPKEIIIQNLSINQKKWPLTISIYNPIVRIFDLPDGITEEDDIMINFISAGIIIEYAIKKHELDNDDFYNFIENMLFDSFFDEDSIHGESFQGHIKSYAYPERMTQI